MDHLVRLILKYDPVIYTLDVVFELLIHLTNIVIGTFGSTVVPQRLKNQSLYHEILLLQKFTDISGKVLKPKKISLKNWELSLKVFLQTWKM